MLFTTTVFVLFATSTWLFVLGILTVFESILWLFGAIECTWELPTSPQSLTGRYLKKCYFIPNNLPTFFWRPDFVVGIPVALATFLFVEDTPSALFQLNDNPGTKLFSLPFFHAFLCF